MIEETKETGLRENENPGVSFKENSMDKNYKSVTDIEELKHYIGDARVVSFDYETAADKGHRSEEKAALDPHKAHITECSYSVQEGPECLYR
jgi:hypothetical protein